MMKGMRRSRSDLVETSESHQDDMNQAFCLFENRRRRLYYTTHLPCVS